MACKPTIAATFDPNFTDYGTPYVPVDDLKLPDTNPIDGRRVEYINFDAITAPKVFLLQDTINTLKTSS